MTLKTKRTTGQIASYPQFLKFMKSFYLTNAIVDDRSKCEVIGSTPGENMFLNVNAPLQMGGRYTNVPSGITTNKFSGCVRNLRHNNPHHEQGSNSQLKW
jgi:hypothetical protein